VSLHDSVIAYKNGNKDDSTGLIESVAAILDARLSEAEKSLTAEVLIGLIKNAETNIRRSLSEKLAPRDDLPSGLLHYLAYDDIEVAEPVLLYSPLLGETDLLYIIHSKGQGHWQTIARRDNIADRVISLLVDKCDDETVSNLLKNETVTLNEEALTKMVDQVTKMEALAEPFLNYKNLPRELAVNVYWHVSHALRDQITARFQLQGDELNTALQDCVQDFADTSFNNLDNKPSHLMSEVAEAYIAKGIVTDDMMISVLRRRQGRFFISLFAKRTNLPHKIIASMMRQKGGQGLAVACRAMNVSKENFVSIFLLCRNITGQGETVKADELKMAARYYDGLTHKMAKEILTDSIAK
jgi:uncharacterized protein (DUF2336 family)